MEDIKDIKKNLTRDADDIVKGVKKNMDIN